MAKKISCKSEKKTLKYYKGMPWTRDLTKEMKDYEDEAGRKAIYRGVITGGFEFWMYWRPKSKLSKKIDIIKDIFSEIIELALISEKTQVDNILINTFTRFRESLKDLKGTGSGFTGISEFLYTEYIKKYFEKELPIIFEKEESGRVNYFFAKLKSKQNEIILSSDVDIKTLFCLQIGVSKPDIFIGIRNLEKKIIPIALIEVKLLRSQEEFAKDITERFREIKNTFQKNQELPFFICLLLDSKENPKLADEIEKFLNLHGKCMIMRKVRNDKDWDSVEKTFRGEIKGSYINDILDTILTELQKKNH